MIKSGFRADPKTARSAKEKKIVASEKKKEVLRSLKFVLFSASAGIIQVVSFALMNELIASDKEYGVSYFVALILSVLWNFTFNRKFTFQSAKNVGVAMAWVALYYVAFTPLSVLWGNALTVKAGWNEYLVLAFTMIVNLTTEFLYTRFWVYRGNIDNNAAAQRKAQETASENGESASGSGERASENENGSLKSGENALKHEKSSFKSNENASGNNDLSAEQGDSSATESK